MTDCPIEPASLLHALARPVLFSLEAERAHELALDLLERVSSMPRIMASLASCHAHRDERLRVEAFGLSFANPLGVAAGLDKDARAVPALAALGFGHVEVGTVTPRPQPGNPSPRVFRLVEDGALVNRLGFPSQGAAAVAARLAAMGARSCIVGVNLGRNKETSNERAQDDYVEGLETLRDVGDYFVVNVSSPNTPGLRQLQSPEALTSLMSSVVRSASGKPVLVKLAPDLDDAQLDASLDAAAAGGAAGFVIGNTTLSRPASLRCGAFAREAGGLSGTPLLERTIALVGHARRRLDGTLPIIGVGGVSSAADASLVMAAGATLVQAYTAFVYAGPGFAGRVLRGLVGADGQAHATTRKEGLDVVKLPEGSPQVTSETVERLLDDLP